MSVDRKLAAVMFTDIVGFTKIMGDNEDIAISILKSQDDIFLPLLEKFSGKLLKKMGDGLLIEFSSAVNAVECALDIQSAIKEYNETDGHEFHIRIGIHLGDIIMLGDDILGDGVNIASRIEPLASPDGICITEAVQQSIKSKIKIDARRISEVDLRHIDDKYTIYKLPKNDKITIEEDLSIKSNSPKIKILELQYLSNTSKELFRSFYKSCIFGLLCAIIYNFLLVLLHLGASILVDKINFYENFSYFPSTPNSAMILIGLCAFGTIILRKKEYKILFKDIRNVDSVLNHMITEEVSFAKYQIVEQKSNTIVYYPYGSKANILKAYEDAMNKFMFKILPFMKDFETLRLTFDGNVVIVKGAWNSINNLKKRLKILELI